MACYRTVLYCTDDLLAYIDKELPLAGVVLCFTSFLMEQRVSKKTIRCMYHNTDDIHRPS